MIVDESTVEADVSMSLRLIVTELVINFLNQAFPDQKTGEVTIDYWSKGDDWSLSVADDRVGILAGCAAPKAGLGSSIVEALTKNLQAEMHVSNAVPATAATIRHHAGTSEQTFFLPATEEPKRC